MPKPISATSSLTGAGDIHPSPSEPFLAMPFCRDIYGHTYWLAADSNPYYCTQGYVKYYDSRNNSYMGAVDVYMVYWNITRSTALVTAWNWCTNNWVCSTIVGGIFFSKISGPFKALWTIVRSVRFGL